MLVPNPYSVPLPLRHTPSWDAGFASPLLSSQHNLAQASALELMIASFEGILTAFETLMVCCML